MPNSYIVMGILAVLCITLGLIWRKDTKIKKIQAEEYETYCKYNELTKCYETCCNYCNVKSECDCCCGGNCKACGGLSLRKKAEAR